MPLSSMEYLPGPATEKASSSSKNGDIFEEVIELVRIAPGQMGEQAGDKRIKAEQEGNRPRLVSDDKHHPADNLKNHGARDGNRWQRHSDLAEVAHVEIMLDDFVVAGESGTASRPDTAGEQQNIAVLFVHGLPLPLFITKILPRASKEVNTATTEPQQ